MGIEGGHVSGQFTTAELDETVTMPVPFTRRELLALAQGYTYFHSATDARLLVTGQRRQGMQVSRAAIVRLYPKPGDTRLLLEKLRQLVFALGCEPSDENGDPAGYTFGDETEQQ